MSKPLYVKREDLFKKNFGLEPRRITLKQKLTEFFQKHSNKGYRRAALLNYFRVNESNFDEIMRILLKDKRILKIAPYYTWDFHQKGTKKPRKKNGKFKGKTKRT